MKFKSLYFRPLRTGLIVVGMAMVLGICLRPLEDPAWKVVRAQQPALKLESLKDALGQGVTVGLLGGFRAIVADFFWLRTNIVWEQMDLPATQTYIQIVTAIDPRPTYFWINGARIISYDMPNWRVDKAGGYEAVPDSVKRKFEEEQSAVAFRLLDTGMDFHPNDPMFVIEKANIYLNRLKDTEKGAEYYHKAAMNPDAPFYAARIYGELLRKLGRKEEAYEWLKQLYPTLPKDPPLSYYSMPEVVLSRIHELEDELYIPEYKRFKVK